MIALPEITDQVVIDATTQPGYAGTPLIEIDGSMANASDGLVIKAGGTTVRGLSIGRFGSNAINLNGCDGNVIQGNYLGVAANGTTARQNNWGIQLTNSSNNLIGGTTPQRETLSREMEIVQLPSTRATLTSFKETSSELQPPEQPS